MQDSGLSQDSADHLSDLDPAVRIGTWLMNSISTSVLKAARKGGH